MNTVCSSDKQDPTKHKITIKITASTGSVISERTKLIKLDDAATEEEIEEAALTAFWEMANFSFEKVDR